MSRMKNLSSARLTPLFRYLLSAILVRTCTGASAIAVILLSRHFGADGALAGTFAACLTVPHILGPVYGRWLEKAKNAFMVIALACIIFVLFFQLAIVCIASQQKVLSFLMLLLCGGCSSFMMGGLSTQVQHLVEENTKARRQAQSWDALTYGIGLTLGPLLIGLLSTQISTQYAASIVMTFPLFACLVLMSMPKTNAKQASDQKQLPSFKQVVFTLWQTPALKTTLLMTSGAAFSFAALPVVAVYVSDLFNQGQESGAYLVTLYGVGCLCGAAFLLLKPLKAEALILLRNIGWLLVGCLILLCLSGAFITSLMSYWLSGVVNAIFFTVTIAARSEYAPKQGAAQIYMWVAAAKITAASLGALAAGLLVDYFVFLPLFVSISVLSLTLLLCFSQINPVTALMNKYQR